VRTLHAIGRRFCKGGRPRQGRGDPTIRDIVKIRALPAAGALLVLVLLAVLGWEFGWRWQHRLLKPQAAAPDGALVAEVRLLPQQRRPTGVYLRRDWELLRAVRPRLVFSGECDEVETRWFGPRRLVIDCELRSGEPQLLQEMVDGVVIEVVVQRRFA
jgi:hypothetical protein